jgi:type I restriction enzyme R subunit
MIATGTDIKPLEIILFMRTVKSRTYFEQMKGRGVRVINPDDLQAVTNDAKVKDHFVIIDAVGVCEEDKTDSRPLEKKPSVSFEKLLQAVSLGNTDPDVISSIAGRMARMERRLSKEEHGEIRKLSGGKSVMQLTMELVNAVNPDKHVELAKEQAKAEPTEEQVKKAAVTMIKEAVKPLFNPDLRNLLIELKRRNEQTIDHVSQDQVIEARFSQDALDRARGMVQSFEQFIKDNKDGITALQILYSMPYRARLKYEDVKDLASRIEKPPHLWRVDSLWNAYAALEKSRVKGASSHHILTDLVSLVRFAISRDNELVPFPERVNANFDKWLNDSIRHSRESGNPAFTSEQIHWLEMIRDHIAANLAIEANDFEYAPFAQQGGLGKVHQIFGSDLEKILDELNGVLAA